MLAAKYIDTAHSHCPLHKSYWIRDGSHTFAVKICVVVEQGRGSTSLGSTFDDLQFAIVLALAARELGSPTNDTFV